MNSATVLAVTVWALLLPAAAAVGIGIGALITDNATVAISAIRYSLRLSIPIAMAVEACVLIAWLVI